ncbi:hypothetical protein C8Q77DRAFT_1071622 [Trametes polyzona]|nr:hypothetical protein C8Q77DRAFT_1071622 [Trametes polyzona]
MLDETHSVHGGDDDHTSAEHSKRASEVALDPSLFGCSVTEMRKVSSADASQRLGEELGEWQAACVLSPMMGLLAGMRPAKRCRHCEERGRQPAQDVPDHTDIRLVVDAWCRPENTILSAQLGRQQARSVRRPIYSPAVVPEEPHRAENQVWYALLFEVGQWYSLVHHHAPYSVKGNQV